MKMTVLTVDNIEDYRDFIGADMAENIGRKYYRGLIAEDGSECLGGIIWQYKNAGNECESAIEWFEAKDTYAAQNLLDYYTETIREEDVKTSVIKIPAIENKEIKKILKEAGFNLQITESNQIIVSLSELSEMSLMNDRKVPANVKTIGEIKVRQLRSAIERCVEKGINGVCEDIEDLPVSFFEQDVSNCYLDDDGEIGGMLLFHRLPSGMLSIQLMICFEKEIGKVIPGMMRLFVTKMEEKYTPDTKIILDRHNEASLLLSEKLLPRGFGIPVYVGNRSEG